MKKALLLVSVFLVMILFFSCENFLGGKDENSPVTTDSIEIPDFGVSDNINKATNIDDEKLLELYYSKAEIPEDIQPKITKENYIDIRPLLYPGMTNDPSKITSVAVSPEELEDGEATLIQKDLINDDIWDIFADSKKNWQFEADTNYKVSFDAKMENPDIEYSTVLVELKDSRRTYRGANLILENLTDKFDNFSFETGCYNKDWDGHLQIALGFFQGDFYIKNLKIEKIEGTSLPCGIYLESKDDSITTEKVENGIKFSFETLNPESTPNSSWASINTGFAVEDNKLYEVTFNASADEKNVTLKTGVYPIDSQYSHSELITTVGTKPIPIKMYMPGAVISSEGYRFAYIKVNTPTNNSITITDVKVKEISKTPQDVDIIVQINNKFGEITEETPYVITQLPNDQYFNFDIAFSKINSTQIDFTDFCRICEFSKDIPESLTVSNTVENGEVVRTFTNNTTEEKYYKISLDSNWKIIFEETDFKVIDGSGQTAPTSQSGGSEGDGTSGNNGTTGESGSQGSDPDNTGDGQAGTTGD